MHPKTQRLLPIGLIGVVFLVGCAARNAESRRFLSREISNASPEEVFRVSRDALEREFGGVRADVYSRTLETDPIPYDGDGGSGDLRSLYGGAATMRQSAELLVAERGAGAVARIMVSVEREDTRYQGYRPVSETAQPAGTPSPSAIERDDAATLPEQNQVWTFVRRNRALERALLAEIQDAFAPPATAPPDGSTPVE